LDKKMLKAVARQIGVVYENLILKAKVDHGIRVQRDVLSHLQDENRNLMKECETCGACFDSEVDLCPADQTELALTLPVERTIDEKYRLERLLGRGGMGAVYEALDLRLQRKIAVKILIGSMFGDRTALSRFEREARASARMNHPNIVSVYDFGGIEGKGAYLVMELLSGFTLRSVLKERGNLPSQIVAAWFEQIFRGVKASHLNGIIHRDLKPENVFVSRTVDGSPVLKILDLGLAKVRQQDQVDSGSLTKPGTILGTLYYMSPEQVAGQEVDERTDIFSLGVMIVEALTGKLPFTGDTMSQIAIQILQKEFCLDGDSPQTARLNSALQKCLAKNRNDRYSSIDEMQEEILPAVLGCLPLAIERGNVGSADTIPH
jgi:eukaryotic-like serine/threonine-protein kinase